MKKPPNQFAAGGTDTVPILSAHDRACDNVQKCLWNTGQRVLERGTAAHPSNEGKDVFHFLYLCFRPW